MNLRKTLMSNTGNVKAKFGKAASYSSKGRNHHKSTEVIADNHGIIIKVAQVSSEKTHGHTIVDFEAKRKRESYRKLNKKMGKI